MSSPTENNRSFSHGAGTINCGPGTGTGTGAGAKNSGGVVAPANIPVAVEERLRLTEDKIDTLAGVSKGIKDEIGLLRGNGERVEELLRRCVFGSQVAPAPAPAPLAAAGSGSAGLAITSKKTKKKKKKKKKQKKGGVANWVAGSSIKIAVALASLALLVSVALALGHGRVGGFSPSLRQKPSDQSTASKENSDEPAYLQIDGSNEHRPVEPATGLRTEPFGSRKKRVVTEEDKTKTPHGGRVTQAKYAPPAEAARDETLASDSPSNVGPANVEGGTNEEAPPSIRSVSTSPMDAVPANSGSPYGSAPPTNGVDRNGQTQLPYTYSPTYVPTEVVNSVDSDIDSSHDEALESQDDNSDATSLPAASSPSDDNHDINCLADPEQCGCFDLDQTDYVGEISTSHEGAPCERWDADWVREELDRIGINPEEHYLVENYCRNPGESRRRAWCFVKGSTDKNLCIVPYCWRPTPTCSAPDNTACGCDEIGQSDYRGTANETEDGQACLPWDEVWGVPNMGEVENFCRNPDPKFQDRAWCFISENRDRGYCNVSTCNPCSCTPPCGNPNDAPCGCPSLRQSENCCEEEEDTQGCKCRYLQEACRKSIENGDEYSYNYEFCDDAEAACCDERYDQHCKCGIYDQMCSEFPNQWTCQYAAWSCCSSTRWYEAKTQCTCDYQTYTSNILKYTFEPDIRCAEIDSIVQSENNVMSQLEAFYTKTGGEHWFDNSGWLGNESYCQWFGITCDSGTITQINLRHNNMTGFIPAEFVLSALIRLDLANNRLGGSPKGFALNRNLAHIDLSNNEFSGPVDMTFPPATLHVNYSHNKLSSVGFNRFNPAYETMRVVDLSYNQIRQSVSSLLANIPPNLVECVLSNNAIRGAFPNPFPSLEHMRVFAIGNNDINGAFPDFPRLTPRMRELDLSNQRQTEDRGLIGPIPADISRLEDLVVLNLAGNYITSIPSDLGVLGKLQVLNVSSNFLNQTIPPELGKLADVLQILDLSNNKLNGWIPSSFSNFEDTPVHLSGNAGLEQPAPLMLCFRKSDLVNDTEMCPKERSALKEFFESAKGQEWTNTTHWLDDFEDHCNWFGVSCVLKNVTHLTLPNNGLSGTLTKGIADLKHLKVLNLTDNGMKGSIPSAIGELTKLTHIHLSYNEFINDVPTQLGNIPHLEVIQLNGNRLSGKFSTSNWKHDDPSSFVADCGVPSDFETPLECDECTMCCNNQGECYPTEGSWAEKHYMYLALIILLCLFGAFGMLAFALYAYHNREPQNDESPVPSRRLSAVEIEAKYSLDTIGNDSVYQFFLGKTRSGWAIALITIGLQVWMLSIFVTRAEVNLSSRSDSAYTWKCPPYQIECLLDDDSTLGGWIAFGLLMFAHLAKDIINGSKLVALSANERHSRGTQMRHFFGGALLASVSVFTLYASSVYNKAIATSDAEIIINSVVILFIADVDELFYNILMAINSEWVEGMSLESASDGANADESSKDLKKEMAALQERLKSLEKQLGRAGIIAQDQDAGDVDAHLGGSTEVRSRSPGRFRKKRKRPGNRSPSQG